MVAVTKTDIGRRALVQADGTVRRLHLIGELLLIWACSFTLFCFQLFGTGVPNISLVFDSQGYLAVTNSWLTALHSVQLRHDFLDYVSHGFSNAARLQLLNQLGSACDVLKTGPTLPLLLSIFYLIAGVPATCQHWLVGTLVMVGLQALTVCCIWLAARESWGTHQARIAAAMATTYSGMAVNCGRIMSEIPAACTVVFACWAILKVHTLALRDHTRSRQAMAPPAVRSHGILLGAALALLTLSRSALVLLPPVCVSALLITQNGRRLLCNWRFFIPAVLSASCLLAPWMLCHQVLTGKPGLTIQRYGPYNLYAGCRLDNDGFDVVPGPFVSHPERFTSSMHQVLAAVIKSAAAQPAEFCDMMARKVNRLLGAPWNDFQTACFGASYDIQLYGHRLLLMLALIGLVEAWAATRREPNMSSRTAALVLLTVVAYHMTYLPFIAMNRYMYTALPALIMLGANGLVCLWRCRARLTTRAFILLTLVLPAASMWASADSPILGHGAGNARLVQSVLSALVLGVVVVWLAALARATGSGGRLIYWTLSVVGLISVACTGLGMAREHMCLEVHHTLSANQPTLSVRCPIVPTLEGQRWFVVCDLRSGEPNLPQPFKDISLSINNSRVPGEFVPLFALDSSQRENLIYQRVFAACAGRQPAAFRQWWAMEVPASLLAHADTAKILVQNNDCTRPVEVAGDFQHGGQLSHELALSEFSWIKGFFAGPPFEPRLDTFVHQHAAGTSGLVRPRIMLLAVDDRTIIPEATSKTIKIADVTITQRSDRRLFDSIVDCRHIPELQNSTAARLKVSGRVRGSMRAQPSIAVIETIRKPQGQIEEEIAPVMPSTITGANAASTFSFADILPLPKGSRLESVRLIEGGRPWFDMLQYANYKPHAAVSFSDVTLQISPAATVDLQNQVFRKFEALPIANF